MQSAGGGGSSAGTAAARAGMRWHARAACKRASEQASGMSWSVPLEAAATLTRGLCSAGKHGAAHDGGRAQRQSLDNVPAVLHAAVCGGGRAGEMWRGWGGWGAKGTKQGAWLLLPQAAPPPRPIETNHQPAGRTRNDGHPQRVGQPRGVVHCRGLAAAHRAHLRERGAPGWRAVSTAAKRSILCSAHPRTGAALRCCHRPPPPQHDHHYHRRRQQQQPKRAAAGHAPLGWCRWSRCPCPRAGRRRPPQSAAAPAGKRAGQRTWQPRVGCTVAGWREQGGQRGNMRCNAAWLRGRLRLTRFHCGLIVSEHRMVRTNTVLITSALLANRYACSTGAERKHEGTGRPGSRASAGAAGRGVASG